MDLREMLARRTGKLGTRPTLGGANKKTQALRREAVPIDLLPGAIDLPPQRDLKLGWPFAAWALNMAF